MQQIQVRHDPGRRSPFPPREGGQGVRSSTLAPNTLAEALATPGRAVYTAELIPAEGRLDRLYRFAEQARHSDVVVSLTDGAGGVPAPSPDPIAADLARLMGRQPIVNVACKSHDRAELLDRVDALYAAGLRNVFAVTGDYPRDGRPVFDLDSVGLLLALRALEAGQEFPPRQPPAAGGPSFLLPSREGGEGARFFAGAAVSPFKYAEAEVWGQRIKAWKKWRAGASYFITQVGYDVKKFHELRLWLARDGMGEVPVLGYVHLLHARNVARLGGGSAAGWPGGGRVAGVYLSPDVQRQGAAMAYRAALRWAALLADVLVRGLGYRGVHFGGFSRFEDLAETRAIVDELAGRDWRASLQEYVSPGGAQPLRFAPEGAFRPTTGDQRPTTNETQPLRFAPEGAFYLFPNGEGGLLRDGPPRTADRRRYRGPPPGLVWAHRHWFEPDRIGARLLRRALAKSDREGVGRLVTWLERTLKGAAVGCQMCGDCRLADLQFRCPEPARGCAKSLRNGPCAGATLDGRCEVEPHRPCYWRLVVESALATGTVAQLYRIHLPRDPALRGTSAWRNFLLGRTTPPLSLGLPTAERPPALADLTPGPFPLGKGNAGGAFRQEATERS